jgi:hypothetical protein
MGHGQYAKANNNGRRVMPQAVNVQVPDVEACASYHCPGCMNNIFEPAFRIFELSALLSPNGIAQPGTEQVWRCTGCGLARPQNMLKKLSPQERAELIEANKARIAELHAQAVAKAGGEIPSGEIVETLPVPEALAQ